MRSRNSRLFTAMTAALLSTLAPTLLAAPPAEWSGIPVTTVKLFYPGQSSYEWTLSKAHKRADRKVAEGDACVSCHEGEEADIGNLLVSGERLEPTPVAGKQGVIDLAIQVAYDDDNAYFRFQWKTLNPYPGIAHPFLRFEGGKWAQYGYPKLDAVVRNGQQPGIYEDRLSMLIDDGSVPNFAAHGCWLTCHTGQRDMPETATKDAVQANPVLGRGGLEKNDLRKYLPSTRTESGWNNWSSTKSADAIAAIMAAGGFLDLMQWRGHRSNPVGMADDFYVLEYRLSDAGKGPFSSNFDKQTQQPRYMYDAATFGSRSITADEVRKGEVALVRERNAAPFDPNAGWKAGELVPSYVVSREDTSGSAADNSDAKGTWENGVWTVVWTRKMRLTNPDDKALEPGRAYTFGFAVHDDNLTTRGHHVSWPMTVGFGAKADIEATKEP